MLAYVVAVLQRDATIAKIYFASHRIVDDAWNSLTNVIAVCVHTVTVRVLFVCVSAIVHVRGTNVFRRTAAMRSAFQPADHIEFSLHPRIIYS